MKLLIAIPSHFTHIARQQAQRDTWIKDVPLRVDIKFFVGHTNNLAKDEIYVGGNLLDGFVKSAHIPMTLSGLTTETIKCVTRWALERDYDFIFKADTDTLINPTNLLASGFEKHDYSGGYNQEKSGEFCSGGAGYWLSSSAMKAVASSGLDYFAEDCLVAMALRTNDILPHFDSGYRWKPGEVVDGSMITYHIPSAIGRRYYDPTWMYEYYKKMKEYEITI